MINNLLIKALLLSFSGSIIALIIFAVKPFVKLTLSKTWLYYIWLAVILRLLIPYTPKVTIMRSLYNFIESNNQILKTAIDSNGGSYIGIAWLSIAAALIIKKIISYQVYTHFIKVNRSKIDNENVMRVFRDICKEMRVENKIGLYSYKMINCPMLIGFLKPYILLPETMLDKTHDLRYILMHEIAHHKRKDFLYKWLIQITICVYFFNPVVYLIRDIVNKYCELSCDEALISKFDHHDKKAYGSALINALEINGNIKQHTAVSLMLCEDVRQIKERLDAILLYRRGANIIIVYTFVLTCLIGLCSVYIGVYSSGVCTCIKIHL